MNIKIRENSNSGKERMIICFYIREKQIIMWGEQMLEVKTFDKEKHTWNIELNGRKHEVRIDVWHDVYIDGEKLGSLDDFSKKVEVDDGYKTRYIIPIDGLDVEYKKYPWEESDAKYHLIAYGIDLETGEPVGGPEPKKITYPWWMGILDVILSLYTLNIRRWDPLLGCVFVSINFLIVNFIYFTAIRDDLSMKFRVIVCAGAVLVFGIIQMLAYMNGLLIN